MTWFRFKGKWHNSSCLDTLHDWYKPLKKFAWTPDDIRDISNSKRSWAWHPEIFLTVSLAQKLIDNLLQSLTFVFLLFPWRCLLITWLFAQYRPNLNSPPAIPPLKMRYSCLTELTFLKTEASLIRYGTIYHYFWNVKLLTWSFKGKTEGSRVCHPKHASLGLIILGWLT